MKRTRFIKFITGLAAVASIGLSAQASAADYTWYGRTASSSRYYYWGGNNQWNNAQGSRTSWSNGTGNNAFFTRTGRYKDAVWIHDALTAGTVHVQDAGYTFTLYVAQRGGTLNISMNELSLEASALTATTNSTTATRTLTLGTLSNTVSSTLTLNSNATVAATNTKVAEGTTLTLAGTGAQAGSLGVLTLGAGSTLAVTNTGANFTLGTSGQTSTLADGAKLSFTGGKTYTLNGTFDVTVNNPTVAGAGEGTGVNGFSKGTITATVVEGNATNNATWYLNGQLASYDNGVISAEGGISYETYHIYNGTVSVTGIYDEAGEHSGEVKTAALHDGTLDLNYTITTVNAEGGSIVMNGGSNTDGTVTLAADTTLSISGDSGSLTFTGGTLAKDAKLSFNGGANYTLRGLYAVQGGTGSTPTQNGFASGTFTADVVEEGTGTVDVQDATWTLNGMNATYNNGTVSATGTAYDTYYIVQSGTVRMTAINTAAQGHESDLKTIALNTGTLSLDANAANQTIIAQNGTTVDAGTAAVTRNIKGLELASGATLTLQGGGNGSTSTAVANINIGTLGVEAGIGTLVVNQNQSDNYMNIELHVTDTVVGDNAKLTVKGQSGRQANSLGAITLGKNAQLELAGHRSSGQGRRFAMTINGGTLDEGAKILISNDSSQGTSTQATYTVTGAFDVTAADTAYTNIQAPTTGNGFATGSVTTTVLQKSSGLSSNVSVTVNGTWTLNGENATYNTNNGTITASNAKYYGTYYMRQNTQSVSGIMAEAGKYAAKVTTVELSGGTLTADATISTVNATGGTLAFVGQGGVDTINVKGDISVSGDTNPAGKVYNIDAQKVITFENGLEMQGLSIVGEGGTKVTVQNVSGATVQYALNEQNALLSADEITMTAQATGAVNVGNKVAAATVTNVSENGYTLTLGNGNSAVQDVIASKGNIIFHNMGAQAISLTDMTIGEGKQVGVYQGADTASEGTVSISDTLTAAGGTLLANLILDGATLDVNGGGDNALTLGSQFGIAAGTLVTLDATTIAALEGLEIDGTLDLVKALSQQDQLSYLSDYDGMWFDALFERTDNVHGDYKVYATGDSFGLTKVSNLPEPTTGTLSLLALAALAARRRRK